MNDRLFSSLLFAVSLGLALIELALLASLSPPDVSLVVLAVALSLAGMLFSVRMLLGARHAVESVSSRRQRAMQDPVMRERLEGYATDEAFRGGACGGGETAAAPSSAPSRLNLETFSLDREGFQEYIGRSMGGGGEEEDGGFCVDLDCDALSRGGGVMPSDFSHDPASVMAGLKRAGGKP
ncbi:hypothetical protein [Pelodictyon luteolum]|nr:hypothetical protein [Pelodictyon luteolum]